MYSFLYKSIRMRKVLGLAILLAICVSLFTTTANADKKKKRKAEATIPEAGPRKFGFDPTKLVWPSPPKVARVKWVSYFAGQKIDYTQSAKTKAKAS